MDHRRADRHAELFDKKRPFQNWSGVFDYNDPSIALQLDLRAVQPGFVKLAREDLIKIPGRYIVEAEICHHGPIPISAVTRAHLLRGRAWIAAYENLESAYARAVTLERLIRRKQRPSASSLINLAILDV